VAKAGRLMKNKPLPMMLRIFLLLLKAQTGPKGPEDWQPAINRCQYAIHWKYLLTKYQLEAPVETTEAIKVLCSIE
jgi:hypothetical protein